MIYALVNVTVLLPPKNIFVKLTKSDSKTCVFKGNMSKY